MSIRTAVLIIGAGPTGLGAAARLQELGIDYLVVDRADTVGGMAASVRDSSGYTWDLGGHVVHSHFPEFDRAVRESGVRLRQVRRNGWVWIDRQLVPAPIQRQLEELPTDLDPAAPAANLADFYRNHFGADLYQRFFRPHTFKMWAAPLERISHEWTSERTGSTDRNVPALAVKEPPAGARPAAPFPYPIGGAGALWTAVSRALVDRSRIHLRTSVVHMDLASHRAVLRGGQEISYEHCVTTAPLTQTAHWAGQAHLTASFHANEVYAIGLGFRGRMPAGLVGKTWLYSPDDDVPWYRLTVLSNYDPGNAGPGRWNVLCEVSTSPHRAVSMDAAVRGSLRSLLRLGVDLHQLDAVWRRKLDYGYPVPTIGRDDYLRQLDQLLRAHGVYSRGRFGGWRYESCNQDHAWMQGRQAVDNALSDRPEDAYWNP